MKKGSQRLLAALLALMLLLALVPLVRAEGTEAFHVPYLCGYPDGTIRPDEPLTREALAQALMNQTRDAHMLLARFGGPSFGGLRNVNNALRRAQAGSVLNMRELLDIASVLRTIRGLSGWRDANAGVETVLDTLFGALTPNKYLEDAIFGAILSEEEMADNALAYSFFHWGIPAWSVYAAGIIPIGYRYYVMKKPGLTLQGGCEGVFGEKRTNGILGTVINIVFIGWVIP